MTELNFKLEKAIVICAERSTVFRYFTDSKRFAAWWGSGSSIEGHPGGKVRICYPNEIVASGEVLEIAKNERVVFTYGYESGKPIGPGTSKVTITLRDHPDGTELTLRHEFEDAATRDMHIQGWRYHLAVFATVVCNEQHAGYKQILEEYLSLWNMRDSNSRQEMLERLTSADVRFRDPYGCVTGRDELNQHIENSQKYMPDLTLVQNEEPLQCQGNALLHWIARRSDGTESARGSNTFQFMPNGLILDIVGFWIPLNIPTQ